MESPNKSSNSPGKASPRRRVKTRTTDKNFNGDQKDADMPVSTLSNNNSSFGDATPDNGDSGKGTLSEQFEELKVLGQGSFGLAVLVRSKKSRKKFVLKKINVRSMSEENVKDALREVQVLRGLNHPNIVGYHGSFVDQGYLNIVLDYCDGGDLEQQVKLAQKRNRNFTQRQIIDWFIQILSGLHYVHRHRILHRDLKAGNVFLTRTGKVKLGDFGIAKVLNDTGTMKSMAQTVIGTPYYMSPELCESRPYSYKSDVWSAGCILYELLTLRRAFESDNIAALIYKIMSGSYPPIKSSIYSPELVGIVDSCLNNDPNLRPSVGELINVPVLQQRMNNLRNSQVQNASSSSKLGQSSRKPPKLKSESFRRNRTPKNKQGGVSAKQKNEDSDNTPNPRKDQYSGREDRSNSGGQSNEDMDESSNADYTPNSAAYSNNERKDKYRRRKSPPPKLDLGMFSPEQYQEVNVSYCESQSGSEKNVDDGPLFRAPQVSEREADAIARGLDSDASTPAGFGSRSVQNGTGGLRLAPVVEKKSELHRAQSESDRYRSQSDTPEWRPREESIQRKNSGFLPGRRKARRSYSNSALHQFNLASDSSESDDNQEDQSLTGRLYSTLNSQQGSRIKKDADRYLREIDHISRQVEECDIEEDAAKPNHGLASRHAENTMDSLTEFEHDYTTPQTPSPATNQQKSFHSRFSKGDLESNIVQLKEECLNEMGKEKFQELYDELYYSQAQDADGNDAGNRKSRSHTVEEIGEYGKVALLLRLEKQLANKDSSQ